MKLGDLCMAIVDCEHRTAPTQSDGFPSIRTPNIGRGYFILDGVNRVSEETYRLWTRRLVPQPGDLIMAREAPVGNVAMIPEGLRPCLGQRTLLIRPDRRRVDPAFLMYMLIGPQVQATIHALTNGVTVPHLNMEDVRALDVPNLPSLERQREIAGVLSAYDGLVEANVARLRVVDEMVRALFVCWFPLQNSLRTNGGSITAPAGWRLGKLGDVAQEMRRNVPKGGLADKINYVGLEHIPRRSLALDDWAEVAELGSNKLAFMTGEVLFGKIRPYFHKVSVAPFDGVCSADTIVLGPKKAEDYGLVVAVVSSDTFVQHATATSNGAKMPRASWSVLREYPVLVPSLGVRRRFSEFVRNVVALQRNLVLQNRNLRQTRDLLLPRLLSGQIELPHAEEAAGTASATD